MEYRAWKVSLQSLAEGFAEPRIPSSRIHLFPRGQGFPALPLEYLQLVCPMTSAHFLVALKPSQDRFV